MGTEMRSIDIIFVSIIVSVLLSCFFIFDPIHLFNKEDSTQKVTACLYQIPDQIKFNCDNRTVNAFGLSLYQYRNAIFANKCSELSGEYLREVNTTHYEVSSCGMNVSFGSVPFKLELADNS